MPNDRGKCHVKKKKKKEKRKERRARDTGPYVRARLLPRALNRRRRRPTALLATGPGAPNCRPRPVTVRPRQNCAVTRARTHTRRRIDPARGPRAH